MRWGAKAAIAAAVVIGLVVGDQGTDTSSFADRTAPEQGGPASLDWRDDPRGDAAFTAHDDIDIISAGLTVAKHELRLSAGMAEPRAVKVVRRVLFRLYRPGEVSPVYSIVLDTGSRMSPYSHGEVCLADAMFECTETGSTWAFDAGSVTVDMADVAALPKAFEWQVVTDVDQTDRFPATRP